MLGLPIMTVELAVGRASQRSIASSFDTLEKKGQKWHFAKFLGIGGNYLLMMFYTTISGWMLIYLVKYLSGDILRYKTAAELPVKVILSLKDLMRLSPLFLRASRYAASVSKELG